MSVCLLPTLYFRTFSLREIQLQSTEPSPFSCRPVELPGPCTLRVPVQTPIKFSRRGFAGGKIGGVIEQQDGTRRRGQRTDPVTDQMEQHKLDINEQLEEMKRLRALMAQDKADMEVARVASEAALEDARVHRERTNQDRGQDPNAGEPAHTATSAAVLAKQTCKHVGCYYGLNGTPYKVDPDMVGPDKGRLKRVAKEMAIHIKEHTTNRINKRRDRPKEKTRISIGMSVGDKMIWKDRFERIKINYPFDDETEEKAYIMESTDGDVEKLVGKLYIETETANEMAERILKIAAGQRNIITNMMKLLAPSNAMAETNAGTHTGQG